MLQHPTPLHVQPKDASLCSLLLKIMDSIQVPVEKTSSAEVEENETRLAASPAGEVDSEERVPHIHIKTIILVFVSDQESPGRA